MILTSSTNADEANSEELSTTINDSPSVFTSSNRDWCAIISTSVVTCAFCIVGFVLLAYQDVSTGLVLLFVSGSILTLTVCAALGKYHSGKNKQPKDRPPSYRVSWRRSFMRRVRATNNQKEAEEPSHQISNTTPDIVTLVVPHESHLPNNGNMLSLSASSLLKHVEGASGPVFEARHTRSLVNIVDPPSYEDVLIAMDETTKRKLKSELCLPSSTHF